jgi:hypothetical protein
MSAIEEVEMLGPDALRRGGVWQCLHWLASGRTTPEALAEACLAAIERSDPGLPAATRSGPRPLLQKNHMHTLRSPP